MQQQYAAENGEGWPSRPVFNPSAQHHRACNINLLRRTPRICGRIAYSCVEGADLSRLPAQEPITSARQRRRPIGLDVSEPESVERLAPIGRLDAWRAWIGPPQGASAGLDCRPLPNPVRDRRNLLQSPTTAVQAPRPSRPVCWRVASVGRCVPELRPRLRHTLEDGVANAEAPSSSEGPTHRIFLFTRRSFASARIGMASEFCSGAKNRCVLRVGLDGGLAGDGCATQLGHKKTRPVLTGPAFFVSRLRGAPHIGSWAT